MLSVLAAFVLAPKRPFTMLFARHGETEANATGKYNSRTLNLLSTHGREQVAQLTQLLLSIRIDAIVVSPSERALRSIAPFLARTGRTAEIWPELYECCDAHSRAVPFIKGRPVRYGPKIVVPFDLQSMFVFRTDRNSDRLIESPSYQDGLRQVRLAADRLRRTFAGSGLTVLVVGHSLHGGRMLELLQGKAPVGKLRPENARLMAFTESNRRLLIPSTSR